MDFFAVDREYEEVVIINKSKFITTLLPINSQQDAIEQLSKLNKKYADATHNCYAYISNTIATEQKFSDDGEPQGTAGVPMLEVLKKKKVYMTLAVVTRYFGGIKLGAGGLVSAYSSCVANAIDNAQIVEYKNSNNISIRVDYSIYKAVEQVILTNNGQIQNVSYDDGVQMEVIIPIGECEKLESQIIDISLGKAIIDRKAIKYNKFIK